MGDLFPVAIPINLDPKDHDMEAVWIIYSLVTAIFQLPYKIAAAPILQCFSRGVIFH